MQFNSTKCHNDRNSEKRNLDHMVHKILAESTRLSRELDKLSKEHEAVLAKLEETGLVVEKSKKQEAVWKVTDE